MRFLWNQPCTVVEQQCGRGKGGEGGDGGALANICAAADNVLRLYEMTINHKATSNTTSNTTSDDV
jgi:GTPase involved in cell partitioning and DNA repair